VRRWQEAAFRKVWTDKKGKTFVQVTVNDAYYDVRPDDVRQVLWIESPGPVRSRDANRETPGRRASGGKD
jgi:hypothetical protein